MITERYRGHGRFDLRLSDDTPSDVVTQLVEFGHVVVTDTPVDPTALGDAGTLAAARYTGVVYRPARRLDLSVRLAGYGPLIHLGDSDGKGDIIETPWRPTASWTFADWINGLLGTINGTPSPLQPGTVTNVAPPSSGDRSIYVRWLNRRQVLDYITDYYSASYRVNPDFTVDAGPETALFNITPTVVLFDRAGEDPVTDGLPATVLDVEWDADDWTSRVVLFGEGQQTDTIVVGTADVATNPYKDPQGNPLVRKRPVSSPITESGEAAVVAQAQLNRFANVSGVVTAATDHPRIRSLVQPGDNIWAWFPEGRVVDSSQQTTHRGEVLSPLVLRVWEIRWPVREGMGVYYRDADGQYVDLTPYVRWETGQARLKVGAASKRIVSRESPPAPDRTWTTPVDNPNLAGGAVTADKVAQKALTADVMSVGIGADNLIRNPGFDDDDPNTSPHAFTDSGGSWSYDPSNARGGSGYALTYDVTGQTGWAFAFLNGGPGTYDRASQGLLKQPPASSGDRFLFTVFARHGGTAPTARVELRILSVDAAGNVLQYDTVDIGPSLTSAYKRFGIWADVHPSTIYVEASIGIANGQPAGVVISFDNASMRRDQTPAGTVMWLAAASTAKIEPGWLLCDGSAVSRTTYRTLFDVIGTLWGAGDGSTTFNLPNLLGRHAIGYGGASGLVAGDVGGSFDHTHSGPSHSHSFSDVSSGPSSTFNVQEGTGLNQLVPTSGHTHSVSGTTGAGGTGATGSNNPPYAALIPVIKA